MSNSASPLYDDSDQTDDKHTEQNYTSEDRQQSTTNNSESPENQENTSFEDNSKTNVHSENSNTGTTSTVRLETSETKQEEEGLSITENKSATNQLNTGRKSTNETKSEENSDPVTHSPEKHTKSKQTKNKNYEERELRFEEGTEDKISKGKNKKKEEQDTNNKPVFNSVTPSQKYEDRSDSRYTDSDTTGGKSSLGSKTPRGYRKKTNKKPNESIKSPRSTISNKSILKPENSKKTSLMASLAGESGIYRQPTRISNDSSSVVTLPALNTQTEINRVYVDDTEKLANYFPKRDKDFKLGFVYDVKQKYPSWYNPEKKLSRREKKVFKNINSVYADYKTQDEREQANEKKREERMHEIEKLKEKEAREKRSKKLETALEQYDQLKEVREKFEILCWYRNQTQYITPRVLEHERLSRHMYGLPESLKKRHQLIKNLKRKNKKQTKPSKDRIKSL